MGSRDRSEKHENVSFRNCFFGPPHAPGPLEPTSGGMRAGNEVPCAIYLNMVVSILFVFQEEDVTPFPPPPEQKNIKEKLIEDSKKSEIYKDVIKNFSDAELINVKSKDKGNDHD